MMKRFHFILLLLNCLNRSVLSHQEENIKNFYKESLMPNKKVSNDLKLLLAMRDPSISQIEFEKMYEKSHQSDDLNDGIPPPSFNKRPRFENIMLNRRFMSGQNRNASKYAKGPSIESVNKELSNIVAEFYQQLEKLTEPPNFLDEGPINMRRGMNIKPKNPDPQLKNILDKLILEMDQHFSSLGSQQVSTSPTPITVPVSVKRSVRPAATAAPVKMRDINDLLKKRTDYDYL